VRRRKAVGLIQHRDDPFPARAHPAYPTGTVDSSAAADPVVLDGRSLTCTDIARVADRSAALAVAPGVVEVMIRARDRAAEVAARRPVYGRSTGVGAHRSTPLLDPESGAADLLHSHAVSAGPLRGPGRVRAMLAVRANSLAAGGGGAAPELLDAVLELVARDELPAVREWGSVGTGDLPALAVTALALPLTLGSANALPFISSNAATVADAALAVVALGQLADAALVGCALTFTAVDGNAEAFGDAVGTVTPFPGARRVARTVSALVADGPAPARIQDWFGLRTAPQVHGALLDCLDRLRAVTEALANAPSENPVFLEPPDPAQPDPAQPDPAQADVAHHGGFHLVYLAQALDAALLALAQSAQLGLSRLVMLSNPDATGLPALLGGGPPAAAGVMIVEYVAAAALGELRALASPASLQTVILSRGVEDGASFAPLAARQALDAVAAYRTVLACELLAAVRAVRMRGLAPPHLAAALDICAPLGRDTLDRDLTEDLATAEGLLGRLSALVVP
jgi:histidine ammonia-lyase